MAAINYAKYEDMTLRQLVISLERENEKANKLMKNFQTKIAQSQELTSFLQSKISEMAKNLKSDFVPIEKVRGEYESFKKTLSQEQIAEIRAIKTAQINAKYDDE